MTLVVLIENLPPDSKLVDISLLKLEWLMLGLIYYVSVYSYTYRNTKTKILLMNFNINFYKLI